MGKMSENHWEFLFKLAGLHYLLIDPLIKRFKYLEAKSGDKSLSGYQLIICYHAMRSIELSLKSFLMQKGRTRSQVRKDFGHDITDLLLEAEEKGLSFDAKTFVPIISMTEYYKGKEFEYTSLRKMSIIPIDKISDIARLVYDEVMKELKKGGLATEKTTLD
jgi:HEPN domain-containing protein